MKFLCFICSSLLLYTAPTSRSADILDVVHMKDLEAIILMIYMRCLYEKCESTRDRFQFINIVSFQAAQGKNRAKYFREQLEKANGREIVFLPYNLGGHRVLVVFDLVHVHFYWLDSLHGEPTEELKLFFESYLFFYKRMQSSRTFSPNDTILRDRDNPSVVYNVDIML
ncbi:hypothetical protein FRX31_013703 [Thalictrum thalictroides]|uniref:Ubiquitin-like protease family profile domain-containing protein n=1 Tax=Thalictrum thalictroides TaxID=46969 RepID=A0A7J6WJ89_THATH|nr:hypothetical protein FRX31_013703 [Thalictrum thalictroides]